MKKKVIALMQARTDSTRLPKKVLKIILDKPMIIHQLMRTSKSRLIDKLILLTSNEKSDDELESVVCQYGFEVFRGDKNNVLKRFFESLKLFNLDDNDIIVRLTGDCPLHDSEIIDEAIGSFFVQDCDYLSNCARPVYPDGLDVEVFKYKCLKDAYLNASVDSDLEHVTPYIRNNDRFKVRNLNKKPTFVNWRLTVDEDIDFHLIEKIFNHFNSTYFSFTDIVNYLKGKSELIHMNNDIVRNEGYLISLLKDKKHE